MSLLNSDDQFSKNNEVKKKYESYRELKKINFKLNFYNRYSIFLENKIVIQEKTLQNLLKIYKNEFKLVEKRQKSKVIKKLNNEQISNEDLPSPKIKEVYIFLFMKEYTIFYVFFENLLKYFKLFTD